MNEYQIGDWVIFTDEFGKEQVSQITALDAYGEPGLLGIEGTDGIYCRKPSEVRPALSHDLSTGAFRDE